MNTEISAMNPRLSAVASLALLLEFVQFLNQPTLVYALFIFGITLLLWRFHLGFIFYLCVLVLSSDTALETMDGFEDDLVTIHTVYLGQSLITIWSLTVLGLTLAHIVHKKFSTPIKLVIFDKALILIGFLFTAALFVGLENLLRVPRVVVHDISYFINILVVYISIRLVYSHPVKNLYLAKVVILCIGIVALKGVIFWFLGIGQINAHVVKPIMDSVRNVFPLLLLLGVSALYLRIYYADNYRYTYIFSFSSAFNIFIYASRGNMIMTVICLMFLFYLLRSFKGSSASFIKSNVYLVVLVTLSIVTMAIFRENSLQLIIWKLSSLTSASIFSGNAADIGSTGTRVLELINIFYHLRDTNSLIWGRGLGGYFRDDYIPYAHLYLGATTYNDEWILDREIFKPHGTPLFLFLKLGLGGAILYYLIFIYAAVRSCKPIAQLRDYGGHYIYVSFLAFLPLLYYKNFTSKLQIIMGILIAVVANVNFYVKYHQNVGLNREK